MNSLYPLKFSPILKQTIWGGTKLKTVYNKYTGSKKIGESWEISAVEGDISVVSNGFLESNNLQDLIEIYMDDLVGDMVYEKFGEKFPLLIKFVDADQPLSVQVHPNDEQAAPYGSFGKTEMWYVAKSDQGAELISGFKGEVDKASYLKHFNEKQLPSILNSEKVFSGDVFFIPSGRVHSIGAGIMVAEIQQTSDITYRIYDWDRVDKNGQPRQLHTDKALDCIDFTPVKGSNKTPYEEVLNKTSQIVNCPYFTTNILTFDKAVGKDYSDLGSFVIYMCIEGEYVIQYDGGIEPVFPGETILLPAVLDQVTLVPKTKARILEIYIS